ncbi:MAG TPA: heat-inducible transcription repressor HrcA [Kosmotogaceae bacterium]|nr:MAG: Heat-inducible transcription repressor HrcA (Modular protein) [Thermotogales bacterium 46_20]HAA85184.1 heat-inducible transcription repressor HrcA [Kosmotogaceae bacterium]
MTKRSSPSPELNDRQLSVLYCVARAYVSKGKAVSSKHVLESSNLDFSSATIRNDMRKLEYLGYITQPHTSAGRVPSDKGLRFYFESVKNLSRELDAPSGDIAVRTTNVIGDIEKLLRTTTRFIAKAAKTLVIIEKPDVGKLTVRNIGITEVAEGYLNFTIVTELGVTMNVTVFSGPLQEGLSDLRTTVNDVVAGRTVGEIRHGIRNVKLEDERWYRKELQQIIYFLENVFDSEMDEENYRYGFEFLMSNPFLDWDDIVGIVQHVENPSSLDELLQDLCQKEPVSESRVFIGEEIGKAQLRNFAVMIAPYSRHEEVLGNVIIISPKVVLYEKVFSQLEFAANRLTEVFSSR